MSRTFAVGDVHGCSKTLRKLITDVIRLDKADEIFLLGDFVDRGRDSKGVIDFILQLRNEGYEIHTIRGNHEEMLLQSEDNKKQFKLWMANGGKETLNSFSISSIKHLDPIYLDFFKQTKYYIETAGEIYVHAGLNFLNPDIFEDKYTMLWTKMKFKVDKEKLNGKLLIHGHVPRPLEYLKLQEFESPFNVDGGCVYIDEDGDLGNLIAFNVTEKKLLSQRNIDN